MNTTAGLIEEAATEAVGGGRGDPVTELTSGLFQSVNAGCSSAAVGDDWHDMHEIQAPKQVRLCLNVLRIMASAAAQPF